MHVVAAAVAVVVVVVPKKPIRHTQGRYGNG